MKGETMKVCSFLSFLFLVLLATTGVLALTGIGLGLIFVGLVKIIDLGCNAEIKSALEWAVNLLPIAIGLLLIEFIGFGLFSWWEALFEPASDGPPDEESNAE
jgi:hypothetical protein